MTSEEYKEIELWIEDRDGKNQRLEKCKIYDDKIILPSGQTIRIKQSILRTLKD